MTSEQTTNASPSAAELAARLRREAREAVLSFPLTCFTDSGEVNIPAFREYLREQLANAPAAVFTCCGTGEFFSVDEDEYRALVTATVDEVANRVPVIAGTGYGSAQARRFAIAAEEAGADGLLLMPPYLVNAPQRGLVRHVRTIAESTRLPLILYQRNQVKFTVETFRELLTVGNVIGLKDGHGDLDQLQRLKLTAPPEFVFFNGVATAEMQARPYRRIGIEAYSSAVHAFAPEIAVEFITALRDQDDDKADRLLREFFHPLVEIRDRQPGYAVSLIKAAARLRGRPVGPVRAPLAEPTGDDLADLEELLNHGLRLVGA